MKIEKVVSHDDRIHHDKIGTILFVVQFLFVSFYALYYVYYLIANNVISNEHWILFRELVMIELIIVIPVTIFVGWVSYIIYTRFPKFLIQSMLVLSGITMGLIAITSLFAGEIVGTILSVLSFVLLIFCWKYLMERVKLAAKIIKHIKSVYDSIKGIRLLIFGLIMVNLFVLIIYIFGILGVMSFTKSENIKTSAGTVSFIIIALSLVWVTYIVHYVEMSIISNIFARYYYGDDVSIDLDFNTNGNKSIEKKTPAIEGNGHGVVYNSVRTTLLKSFGSICIGAIFSTIISLIESLVSNLPNEKGSFVRSLLDSILYYINYLYRMFNEMGCVENAIYGGSYVESSKAAWRIVKASGVDIFIQRNMTDSLTMIVLVITELLTICAVYGLWKISAAFGLILNTNELSSITVNGLRADNITFVVIFMQTLSITAIILSLVSIAVTVVCVCFSEDSEGIRKKDEELYSTIVEVIGKV